MTTTNARPGFVIKVVVKGWPWPNPSFQPQARSTRLSSHPKCCLGPAWATSSERLLPPPPFNFITEISSHMQQ